MTECRALRSLRVVLFFEEKAMTENIDASCISVCESVCHFIERIFGVHPFWLSSLGYIVATLAFFAWTLDEKSATLNLFACILVLIALTNLRWTPKFIRDNYLMLSRGLANPLKADPSMQGARLMAGGFMLGVALCSLLFLKEYFIIPMITSIGIWLCAYLRSCDPLPPNRKAKRMRLLSQISQPRRA